MKKGRKLKTQIEPKLVDQLCKLLASGCSCRTACEAAGMSETTFYSYLRGGDPTSANYEKRYAQFAQRVSRARGAGKAELVGCVRKAARSDWRAALELLRSIAPSEYSIHRETDEQLPAASGTHLTVTMIAAETLDGSPMVKLPPYKIVPAPED